MLAAAPLLAASLTQDARLVAGLTVSLTLPYVLFGLPGGVLVDWLDRRRLMYAVNLVRGTVTAAAALLAFLGWANIFLLYGLFFLIGTGETIFRNAAQSIVPSLVSTRSLARANGGLLMGEIMGTEFVGPPLGGFLFSAGITLPLTVNAATFGIGAVLLMAMPPPPARPRSEDRRRAFLPAIAEGMSWLAREPLLRALAVVTGAINLTTSAVIAIMVLYARQRLHLGGAGYGLLLSCGAVGSIAGSIAAPWAARSASVFASEASGKCGRRSNSASRRSSSFRTRSTPVSGHCVSTSLAASFKRRRVRLRTTALPTFRVTVKPSRAGSAVGGPPVSVQSSTRAISSSRVLPYTRRRRSMSSGPMGRRVMRESNVVPPPRWPGRSPPRSRRAPRTSRREPRGRSR